VTFEVIYYEGSIYIPSPKCLALPILQIGRGPQKFKMGQCDFDYAFVGVICHPYRLILAKTNLCIKFEKTSFNDFQDEKDESKFGVVRVIQRHHSIHRLIDHIRLFTFCSHYVQILYRFRDRPSYWLKIANLCPRCTDPIGFMQNSGTKKLEAPRYHTASVA